MLLRFRCPGKGNSCGNESWVIDYETEAKDHKLICLKCGYSEKLEYLFRGGGKIKNAVVKPVQQIKSVSGEGTSNKVWVKPASSGSQTKTL